jgi:hypothetical protein
MCDAISPQEDPRMTRADCTATGGFSQGDVERAMGTVRPDLEACYVELIRHNPRNLSVGFQLGWAAGTSGGGDAMGMSQEDWLCFHLARGRAVPLVPLASGSAGGSASCEFEFERYAPWPPTP